MDTCPPGANATLARGLAQVATPPYPICSTTRNASHPIDRAADGSAISTPFGRVPGRHAQAIAEMQKALALDPLSFPVQSFYGRTLVWAGRTSDALAQFAKATRSNPNSALEYVRLAHTYAAMGNYPSAIRAEETARILAGESPEAAVAQGQLLRNRLHDQGTAGYWQQELLFANLPDNPPESFTGAYGLAVIYAQLGQKQKAIAALQQALHEHDLRLTEISIEPLLKPLHADPAFHAIQARIGLPQTL
ncbi:MAG: tetratricopeptide repeat protein [Acidobacteriaceae bacterium]